MGIGLFWLSIMYSGMFSFTGTFLQPGPLTYVMCLVTNCYTQTRNCVDLITKHSHKMRPSSCALVSCYKRSYIQSCRFLQPTRHCHVLHLASLQVKCSTGRRPSSFVPLCLGAESFLSVMTEVFWGWLMRLRRSDLLLSQKELMLRYTVVYKAFWCLCLPATQNGHTAVRSGLPIRPYCEWSLTKMLHAVPITKLYSISYPHHDVWFIRECWANL
jgi:hypothetical protein